jgi:hypothetical protein
MAESNFSQVLPGALTCSYVSGGTIGFGCAVGYPDASGIVAAVTSGAILGVAANDVVVGELVTVVFSGPAYTKLAGTVTWASNVMLKPTTAGEFVAAAANETSQVRVVPFPQNGASGVDNDIIQALVGVGAVHA